MSRTALRTLAAIWLCFLARGLFYAAVLPLWEGYDEYSHFAYLQHLRAYSRLPIPGQTRHSREVSRSLTALPLPWTQRNEPGATTFDAFWKLPASERAQRTAVLRAGSDAAGREEDPQGTTLYESQQPPLYYWLMTPVLTLAENWSLGARVFLLRSVSLLLCSFALPLGFGIARRVWGSEGIALCVVAIVVCMPEGMIDLVRVGNESLALLVYTLLTYACVRLLEEGANWRISVMIGIALGCGLLTKAYFLTAIPCVCVAYAMTRRWRGAGYMAASLAIAAAMAGWWYRFIYSVTGDFTGQIQSVSLRAVPMAEKLRVALTVDWLRALDSALFSHIWFGGWSFLQLRSWMYHVFYAIGIAAILGLAMALRRRRLAIKQPGALLLLACFEAGFVACLAYQVTLAQIVYKQPMTAGWYLYCLVFAEVILLCAGLMALLPVRVRIWAPVSLAALFAVLDLYGMNLVLMPYYLGLNAHTAAGRLPAFHPGQAWQTGLAEISARVMASCPYLNSSVEFYAMWAAYLIATVACWVAVIRFHGAPWRRPADLR